MQSHGVPHLLQNDNLLIQILILFLLTSACWRAGIESNLVRRSCCFSLTASMVVNLFPNRKEHNTNVVVAFHKTTTKTKRKRPFFLRTLSSKVYVANRKEPFCEQPKSKMCSVRLWHEWIYTCTKKKKWFSKLGTLFKKRGSSFIGRYFSVPQAVVFCLSFRPTEQ